jgi:hypothetical protein
MTATVFPVEKLWMASFAKMGSPVSILSTLGWFALSGKYQKLCRGVPYQFFSLSLIS